MIAIQWEDVIGVLQTCAPYLIALAVVVVLGLAVVIGCRKMVVAKRKLVRSFSWLSMLTALVVVVNMICFGPMSSLIDLSMGSGTVSEETTEEAAAVAMKIAEEGIVLFENDGLLPIAEPANINLFGWASTNPLYGGAGSGGLNELYEKVSLIQGLENSGFKVNQELVDGVGGAHS